MAKRGFNYSFRLYLEGILTPFKGATIVCTPNGVEANIAVFSNKTLLDLKPKTAVQIVYRDWIVPSGKAGWRLLFDGFFSSFYKVDEASQGRSMGITCRDFRMDIRRAPAALCFQDKNELTTKVFYNTAGVFQTWVVRGINPESTKGAQIRTYGNSGIDDVGAMLQRIAGTAYGKGLKRKDGEYLYSASFGKAMVLSRKEQKADGHLFLDSLVRGLWLEATGGTSVNAFLNKRIRVDKRFFIPSNRAGYNYWSRLNAGIQGGGYMMGNARFTSVEAAIMRLAGLFSCRPYSCSTPSLISIAEDAPSVDNVIAGGVRKFLVEDAKLEFGAKYILNETMLLPPLEFSAPPNCNLIFPPMCHRITWQYDTDVDVTRGYFKQVDVLSTPGSNASLASPSFQVPNALFNIISAEGSKEDRFKRWKPPLTLEERYKGVNVHYGSVEWALAKDDAVQAHINRSYSAKRIGTLKAEMAELQQEWDEIASGVSIEAGLQGILDDPVAKLTVQNRGAVSKLAGRWRIKMQRRKQATADKSSKVRASTDTALKHHAVLKFLNLKYAGRVVVVDGPLNPYIMCGFPGAVVADDLGYGGESLKTIIGMVQQVKHQLVINPNGAEASTSIVLNNARFEDEPTDIDKFGNPLYMKSTDTDKAKINIDTLEYQSKDYHIPAPSSVAIRNVKSEAYDLDKRDDVGEFSLFKYAKDLLTLTEHDKDLAKSNQIYLDEMYAPNRIAKFYSEVFPHHADHFMIGSAPDKADPKKRIFFMYDTIHEALVALRTRDPQLMVDYRRAMEMVTRQVCSADAFFQGILGLSIRESKKSEEVPQLVARGPAGGTITVYTNTESGFDDSRIQDEYFGISTDSWDSDKRVQPLKESTKEGGHMTGPGQCSSIREHMPLTAFIEERKAAVRKYVAEATKIAQGAQFRNADR